MYKRHAELGFLAVRGTDKRLTGGVPLPGGIPLVEWDGFHSIVAMDEMTRYGTLSCFSMVATALYTVLIGI